MLKRIYKLGEMALFTKYRDVAIEKHELLDLFWECTLSCNAKCKHCGSNAEGKKYPGELTTDEIKEAFRQIAHDMDATKILINVTGGEPLVRKDLCDVMKYATNELGFRWGMTTNGILLTQENIAKLKDANMEVVSISIDGLKSTHDEFRGVKGSYEKIIQNIKNLKEANFLKHLQVTTVVHKDNIDELEDLYKIMNDLDITSWRIMPMDPIGRANENDNLLLDGKQTKYVLDFIKKKNKKGKLALQYGCPGFLGIEYEKEVRPSYFFCRTGISVASILYNGDLYVCPNVKRMKKLVQGNILKDNFKDVWENRYKVFRDKNRTSSKECKNCDQWEYCLGGALHTWDFEKGKQINCTYKKIKEIN